MKLQVVMVLGICLVQMCFVSVNSGMTIEEKNAERKRIHESLGDVSERFIDDVSTFLDKFEDQQFVTEIISKNLLQQLIRIQEHGKMPKIDANSITSYIASVINSHVSSADVKASDKASYNAFLKSFQSILSKRVPSEIANGMMNLLYATSHPNATTEDIENAVNYLYSNETVVIKDPLRNIRKPSASECPIVTQRYSAVQNDLKAMTDIKPSVLEDVATIIEKFPCAEFYVTTFLEDFVEIIKVLRKIAEDEERPISACMVWENSRYLARLYYRYKRGDGTYDRSIGREEIENEMKRIDLILATRLMDERFRSIINFEKAAIAAADTPIDEIQKALEYVFIDVTPPETKCPLAERIRRLEALESDYIRAIN